MTACLGCRAGAGAPADQGAVRDGKQGEWQFSATAQYVKSGRTSYLNLSGPLLVPEHCQLARARAKIGSTSVVEITFFSKGVTDERNAVLELWMGDGTCYFASIGKARPKCLGDLGKGNELVLAPNGDTAKLRRGGTWTLDGATVRFEFKHQGEFSPLVAILRWLPDREFRREPAQLFEGTADSIILPKGTSIMVPWLRFPGR